jgi:hypothetical protein
MAAGFCARGAGLRGRQEKMGEGEGSTKVGRQDKRTAAKVALSGCLHIEKHGTSGLSDGAIVGCRALKPLILLAGSGWQAGGNVAPDAFKPLNH